MKIEPRENKAIHYYSISVGIKDLSGCTSKIWYTDFGNFEIEEDLDLADQERRRPGT